MLFLRAVYIEKEDRRRRSILATYVFCIHMFSVFILNTKCCTWPYHHVNYLRLKDSSTRHRNTNMVAAGRPAAKGQQFSLISSNHPDQNLCM